METNELDQIANAAQHITKVGTKADAFEIVRRVLSGEALPRDDAAKLYRYFLPARPKARTPEAWLYLATRFKDVRTFCRFIFSDGSDMYGTDGHSMHIVRGLFKPEGYYDTGGGRVQMDGEKPPMSAIQHVIATAQENTVPLPPGTPIIDYDGQIITTGADGTNVAGEPLIDIGGVSFTVANIRDAVAGFENVGGVHTVQLGYARTVPTVRLEDEKKTRLAIVAGVGFKGDGIK